MFQPHFTLNYAMVKALAKAEAANMLAFSALVPLSWQRRWSTKAIPWSVSANVALDGNPLSFDQVEKIVVREPTREDHAPYIALQAGVEASAEPVQEVINFFHTLRYVHELARSDAVRANVSANLLLDLHSLVTEKSVPLVQVGAWRSVKLVVRQDTGGEVVFTPPTPIELKYQLDDFFSWLDSAVSRELPVLIKAAVCWAELSRIYPFAVANGRVTRSFVRLVLGTNGFHLAELLPYEQDFLENRAAYYQTLVKSIRERDFSAWIEFYLRSWAVQAEGFLDQVNSKDMKASIALVHQPLPLRERQIKLLEFLRQNAWVSIPQLRELAPGVSDDSLLRDLRDLMKKGLAKKRGKTKAARYAIKGGAW